MTTAGLQQANQSAADALAIARAQHASELQRLMLSHADALSTARREAALTEAERVAAKCSSLESRLVQRCAAATRSLLAPARLTHCRVCCCREAQLRALERDAQIARYEKAWAPSARELVALEEQVQEMAGRLEAQHAAWLRFFTVRTPQRDAGSCTARVPDASAQDLAVEIQGAPAVSGQCDAKQLQMLTAGVEQVLSCALELQQQQGIGQQRVAV